MNRLRAFFVHIVLLPSLASAPFAVSKLTGALGWPWWAALFPLWVLPALAAVMAALFAVAVASQLSFALAEAAWRLLRALAGRAARGRA